MEWAPCGSQPKVKSLELLKHRTLYRSRDMFYRHQLLNWTKGLARKKHTSFPVKRVALPEANQDIVQYIKSQNYKVIKYSMAVI